MKDHRSTIVWTHPSYRDLVIEELAEQTDLRMKFLRTMSLEGIRLAISDTVAIKAKGNSH